MQKGDFGVEVPAGTFNMVFGDESAGDVIVRHPLVRCVSFTGSKAVGDLVDSIASGLGKRVMKEVGGVNIFYVHTDSDILRAARNFVYGKTITCRPKMHIDPGGFVRRYDLRSIRRCGSPMRRRKSSVARVHPGRA